VGGEGFLWVAGIIVFQEEYLADPGGYETKNEPNSDARQSAVDGRWQF
jgi:hypothetical protein